MKFFVSLWILFTVGASVGCQQFLLASPSQPSDTARRRPDTARLFTSLQEALRFPESVYKLDLSDQKLGAYSDSLGRFRNLRYLSLRGAGLERVPSSIVELTELRELDLSRNLIQTLPPKLARLNRLHTLYLNEDPQLNLLRSLEVLAKLRGLRELHLESDNITVVPALIGKLKGLENLYLNDNEIHGLPQEMRALPRLRFIDLHQNPIMPKDMDELSDFGIKIRF